MTGKTTDIATTICQCFNPFLTGLRGRLQLSINLIIWTTFGSGWVGCTRVGIEIDWSRQSACKRAQKSACRSFKQLLNPASSQKKKLLLPAKINLLTKIICWHHGKQPKTDHTSFPTADCDCNHTITRKKFVSKLNVLIIFFYLLSPCSSSPNTSLQFWSMGI